MKRTLALTSGGLALATWHDNKIHMITFVSNVSELVHHVFDESSFHPVNTFPFLDFRQLGWMNFHSFCMNSDGLFYIGHKKCIFILSSINPQFSSRQLQLRLSSKNLIQKSEPELSSFICTSNSRDGYGTMDNILVKINMSTGLAIDISAFDHKQNPRHIIWDTSFVIPDNVFWVIHSVNNLIQMALPLTIEQIKTYILTPERIMNIPLVPDLWNLIYEYTSSYYFHDSSSCSISILQKYDVSESLHHGHIVALTTLPSGNMILGVIYPANHRFALFVFNLKNQNCTEISIHDYQYIRTSLMVYQLILNPNTRTLFVSDDFSLYSIKLDSSLFC